MVNQRCTVCPQRIQDMLHDLAWWSCQSWGSIPPGSCCRKVSSMSRGINLAHKSANLLRSLTAISRKIVAPCSAQVSALVRLLIGRPLGLPDWPGCHWGRRFRREFSCIGVICCSCLNRSVWAKSVDALGCHARAATRRAAWRSLPPLRQCP
jgi:hypothetical protein